MKVKEGHGSGNTAPIPSNRGRRTKHQCLIGLTPTWWETRNKISDHKKMMLVKPILEVALVGTEHTTSCNDYLKWNNTAED